MKDAKYKVAYVTGSRADYGIVCRFLKLLASEDAVQLSVLATGSMVGAQYGQVIDLIRSDGFALDFIDNCSLENSSIADTLQSMSEIQKNFGHYFQTHRYSLLIILGDRYEMLPVAIAAAMHRIPILHLHGGELTLGNYDEFIRHAITKMSAYHFTATEVYRQRVIQLGEHPERVYYLGALGAENCLSINMNNVPQEIARLPRKGVYTILFHPETHTDADPAEQTEQLLSAVSEVCAPAPCYFIGGNADTYADVIRRRINDFCQNNASWARQVVNLHPDAYHYLVRQSIALIGNSSSGLIEAPTLGTPTVNIGDRQRGRVRGSSVLDVPCISSAIARSIRSAKEMEGPFDNPYYHPYTVKTYVSTTLHILEAGTSASKDFHDFIRE